MTDEAPHSGEPVIALVLAALRRSGLRASDEEIASLAFGYATTMRQLDGMREWIDRTAEPALTFSAASGLAVVSSTGE